MIEGMESLFKKLEKYENLSLENSIGKAIDFVQSAAKNSCPVYDGKLRESILTATEQHGDEIYGICYTNTVYAPYVEMGTGPKGQTNHNGISTNVEVSYSQNPWWVHESQINQSVAEKYRWFWIDTPEGKFYQCSGQAAHPFMYPALKDHENEVTKIIGEDIRRQLK